MTRNQHAERVARRVGEVSRAKRVTQAAIGHHLGISQQAVNRRFVGEIEWRVGELYAIAELLGTPYAELVADDTAELSTPTA
ncbi:helix-turn-helix domain-containing protein [Rhodococcoides fascians]|uniref:helix-turn-helix domain-containing protein n=1 Tax=Rhodococcoides fascians TaxID=1828 RepID=UPI000522EDCF|nr:helix-turn-helix transcriptional regulator [Rhodococcus fascians]